MSAVQFLDPSAVEELTCNTCDELFEEPVKIPGCRDDHIFCMVCFYNVGICYKEHTTADLGNRKRASIIRCPICDGECPRDDAVRVKSIDRQIKQLAVKCPNYRYYTVQQEQLEKKNKENAQIRRSSRLKRKQNHDAPFTDIPLSKYSLQLIALGRKRKRVSADDNEVIERKRQPKRAKLCEREHDGKVSEDEFDENSEDDDLDAQHEPEEGCVWTGKYSEIAQHRRICPFEIQKCQFGCGASLLPRELRAHYEVCLKRSLRCSLCGEDDLTKRTMEAHLKTECPMAKTKCICGEEVRRRDLAEHQRKVCRETIVACPYQGVGCDKVMKRKDVVAHCRQHVYLHLSRVYAYAHRMEKENKDLRRYVFAMDYRLRKLEKKPRRQTIDDRSEICNRFSLRGVLSDEDD